jgi:hypothetical protein
VSPVTLLHFLVHVTLRTRQFIGAYYSKANDSRAYRAQRLHQLDRERYRISPLMSDSMVGPIMELRPLFEYFLHETGGGYNEAGK